MNLPAYTNKLPKSVIVCGCRYTIKYNLKCGACFDCHECTIVVGCGVAKDVAIRSLIHEISEIAHVELLDRYRSSSENGDIRFIMNHDEFERHNNALVGALRNCGLLKR